MTADWGQPNIEPKRQLPLGLIGGLVIILIGAIGAAIIVYGPQLRDEVFGTTTTTTEPPPDPEVVRQEAAAALDTFLAALEAGDLSTVEFAQTASSIVVEDFETVTAGVAPLEIDATAGEMIVTSDEAAQASITLAWTLADGVPWETTSRVELAFGGPGIAPGCDGSDNSTANGAADSGDGDAEAAEGEAAEGDDACEGETAEGDGAGEAAADGPDQWRVRWQASILEPSLVSGDQLGLNRTGTGRSPILGRDGTALVDTQEVVRIGIEPQRVEDLGSLVATLEQELGIDGADLTARVQAASPDAFVDVATLPRPDYEAVRSEIFPIPGTVFQETVQSSALSDNFARGLLGRSGEVTAEIIERFPGLYEPGDIAGLSGLQASYNAELTGTPGAEITVLRAPVDASETTTTGTGLTTTTPIRRPNQREVLEAVEAVEAEPMVLTLDPQVQLAAEQALQQTELNSALVAIQVSTGEVLAVANGPAGASVNFAFTGQYPPGSIFKVVTGYALLRDQLDMSSPAECPQTFTVEGRSFGNAEDEVLGSIDFRSAFAHSCNTAFAGLTTGFAFETLHDTAAEFGLGVPYDSLGDAVFSGDVPVNADRVDLASAAFGQGRILVSPLSAAVMAATAADGTYRSPVLVASPAPADQVTTALDPGPAAALRELMRAVVTEGTGRAVQGVPGPPVSGKTGTAEFGNQDPPQSHAWFVGYQGDVAFAVLVEAGEFGGSTAAPIAAQFLTEIQGHTITPRTDPSTIIPADDADDDDAVPADDEDGGDSDNGDSDNGDSGDDEQTDTTPTATTAPPQNDDDDADGDSDGDGDDDG